MSTLFEGVKKIMGEGTGGNTASKLMFNLHSLIFQFIGKK